MNIRIDKIVTRSYVDGPGCRSVVFFQGCSLHCPGCQNQHLWDKDGGEVFDHSQLAGALAYHSRLHGNVTISGGEPFDQVEGLSHLTGALRQSGKVKHIIVYTGYTFEDLINKACESVQVCESVLSILFDIDVLVDGPFIKEQDDPFITYRGSRNQRPIDVRATFKNGHLTLLDWANPEAVITPQGNSVMPVGLAAQFTTVGASSKCRMCGQTR